MKQAIQPYNKQNNALATHNTVWGVAREASYPIQKQRRVNQGVIKVNQQSQNIQQQEGTNMKINHLFFTIVLIGVAFALMMYTTANHMIDATPAVQQTAQVQAEWNGRVAIAEIAASVAKETDLVYNAARMFDNAATFGLILLSLVTFGGGALWWISNAGRNEW